MRLAIYSDLHLEFRDWLELGFKGHVIDSPDHPVLRRLRLED